MTFFNPSSTLDFIIVGLFFIAVVVFFAIDVYLWLSEKQKEMEKDGDSQ